MNKLTIFYDNHCSNCTHFTNLIQKLDWFSFIHIRQLRKPEHTNKAIGINKNLAEKLMASFDGNWNYGYPTLFKIFLRIPIFWLFIPFFCLLKITKMDIFIFTTCSQ